MNDAPFDLPIQQFLRWVYEKPDEVYLTQPDLDGALRHYTWRQVHHEVTRMAQHLQRYPKASRIAIYSLNCAHWIMADLAIWYAGHISVPIYPTAGKDNIQSILEHSGAELVFVGKLYDFVDKKSAFPARCKFIAMHQAHADLMHWDELVKRELPLLAPCPIEAKSLATIIYTSGTTGSPKGVMQSFASAAFVGRKMAFVAQSFGIKEGRFFSYLPLAHVAERCAVELASLVLGGKIHFVASIESFGRDLARAKPTVFFGVPRIWLKLQQGILAKITEEKLNNLLAIPIFGALLQKWIRRRLGLHTSKLILSGGASIDVELIQWWERLGVSILEVYGMTETFAYSHLNMPGRRGIGTVGEVLPDAECQIQEDGEIWLKSEGVMMGYYLEPAMTAETLQEGWVRTGDLGHLDGQGRLIITGRKKDMFKTEKGKYVSPVPIETQIETRAGVEQVCVVGAGLCQPIAIVVGTGVQITERELFEQRLENVLNEINDTLDPHERLAGILVVNDLWHTDNGLLTPTLKIRRHHIEQHYRSQIGDFFNQQKTIMWQT